MVFEECGQDRVFVHPVRACALSTDVCAKVSVTDITVTLPIPNVVAPENGILY